MKREGSKREFEVVHRFKSEDEKERSENLYKILQEYKEHLQAIQDMEGEEEIENDHGSPLY
ncbi:MAG: hypothetical protein Q4F05_02985 [bacterium]|nr:hypothetical protein [bacterium]